MKYISKIDDNIKYKITLYNLIIIFSGLFGFLYEVIFYYLNSGCKQVYFRGANFLPWIDIYALGAISIYFLVYKYKNNVLKVFAMSGILCGLIELLAGILIYILRDGHRSWNYNTEILNFGNIGGFVCLRSVLFFALAGLILIYLFVPFCKKLIKLGDKDLMFTITMFICTVILLDEFYNLIIVRLFPLKSAGKIYRKLGLHYVKS